MSNVAREVLTMDTGTPMRHRFRSRAFTLVEVMIVVAMIGVLAAIAIVSFRKYVKSSKVSEPIYVMQGIRAAEESYRSETMTYLDVTQSGGKLTQDVTQGYGPEMYVLPSAPAGRYQIRAHYFAQVSPRFCRIVIDGTDDF